ncbi:MAG: amino acid-binding protein [Propionibacteriaceae bacterium]|jgi:hypothetical protein|nr:amino acid-binding protein [Propionibacteriaceae bacterium]
MFLLRVQLPEAPGALGRVASAVGAIGANIHSLEIIDHGPGYAIDDFMVDLPAGLMPDTLVSACQEVSGVRILWVSRHHSDWSVESDISVLNRMAEAPDIAGQILTQEAPVVFHSTWAALLLRSDPVQVLQATDLAPDFAADGVVALGDLTAARAFELPAEWLPQWGETLIALAPLSGRRTIVVGRQGGPTYLDSELTRLQHLAALAG